MIKAEKMIKDLKYLEAKRKTMYVNKFPYNLGYVWKYGSLSFDCINMIKAYLSYPKIVYKKKPAGFHVKIKLPDVTGKGLMQLCGKKSKKFKSVTPGADLLYQDWDHSGIYVGNFRDGSGIVNTIECTTDWDAHGVTTSYMDENGGRWDHKGGTYYGDWIMWGLLDKYVDYSGVIPKKKKTTLKK